MDRRGLGLLCLLLLYAVCTLAVDPFTIKDEDSFREFQERVNSGKVPVDVVLACDLDLSAFDFTKPIGKETVNATACKAYSGTFDGQGHTIKGINMTGEENIGLFCEISDATVVNLFLEASELVGNTVGTLAGKASKGLTLKNVHSSGNVLCETDAGGLVGVVAVSNLHVENCSNSATVTSAAPDIKSYYERYWSTAGGLFGTAEIDGNATVVNCWNEGFVNGEVSNYGEAYVGGLIGLLTTNGETSESLVSFTNCTNANKTECAKVEICLIGGIIGYAHTSGNKTFLAFEHVTSTESIETSEFTNNYLGGTIGSLEVKNDTFVTFTNCHSLATVFAHDGLTEEGGDESGMDESGMEESGMEEREWEEKSGEEGGSESEGTTISSESSCGGFIGSILTESSFDIHFESCVFNGSVIATNAEKGYTGGFVGSLDGFSLPETYISFVNNTSDGVIDVANLTLESASGGFVGTLYADYGKGASVAFSHCTNRAQIQVAGTDMTHISGGFVAEMRSENSTLNLSITECVNRGDLLFNDQGTSGEFYMGGFIGEYWSCNHSNIVMKGDINYGQINSGDNDVTVRAGGLVASIGFDSINKTCTVVSTNCINYGNIIFESFVTGGYGCGLFGFNNDKDCKIEPITNCLNYGDIFATNSLASGLVVCENCDGISVVNSVNKGQINGLDTYGIIEKTGLANNVANLVTVLDEDGSFGKQLWQSAKEWHNSFTVRTINKSESGVVYVIKNEEGVYETENGEDLATLMTNEAILKQYSTGWNSNMDFEPFIQVHFSSFQKTVFFKNDSKASESPLPDWVNKFRFVTKDGETVFNTSMVINKDWEFVAWCKVNLSAFGNESTRHVEYGSLMKSVDEFSEYLNDEYFILDRNNNSIVYRGDDRIEDNINLIVAYNCRGIKESEKCKGIEECHWKNGECFEKEERNGLSGGAIAGIVIGVLIVVSAVVGLLILFMMKKKNEKTDKDIEVELAKTCVIGGNDGMNKMEYNDMMMATGMFQTNGLMAYKKSETITLLINQKETTLTLKELIGSGSFAKVWKAEAIDGSTYAVKKVETRKTEAVKGAEEEAEMMERLDSKYIAKVYGCLETDKCLFTVMEFFELGSLDTVLQRNGLSPELRIPILLEIAHGMEYLHGQGIIHRDLKPGNVLVKSLDLSTTSTTPMCKFVSFFTFHHLSLFHFMVLIC